MQLTVLFRYLKPNEILKEQKSEGCSHFIGHCTWPFGVHRLYLGTSEKVPFVFPSLLEDYFPPHRRYFLYSIHQGLEQYQGNDRVVMW